MIRKRQVFQLLVIEYIGSPVISVTVDGASVISSLTLPNNTFRETRILALPETAIGFVAQLQSTSASELRHQFVGVAEDQFSVQQLFQYYEIAFKGTVRCNLFVDQVTKKPENSLNNFIDLLVREGRTQDTRKIYFPALSYGYIPHVSQTLTNTQSGNIISVRPIALPAKFNKGIRRHSEYQITYRGDVNLAIYLDGRKIVDRNLPQVKIPQDGGYATLKDYFPSDSNGNVLQYMQTSGDGDIALFETDQTLLDTEQPQQPMS